MSKALEEYTWQEIELGVNPKHFGSFGDLYLFGAVLDFFLGTYANINSFTHFKVTDTVTGETIRWPVRI